MRRICQGTQQGRRKNTKEEEKTTAPLSLASEEMRLYLFPVNEDTARPSRRDADSALRLAAQPLDRTLVVLELVLERVEARAVVLADPVLLLFAEHVFEHHTRLNRHARQPLKAEPALLRVEMLRAHVAHDEDGLYADTEFVRLV
jgi:hypothetical protein